MRFIKYTIVASALALGACGGGDKTNAATDSAAATPAATTPAATTTPAAGAPATGAAPAAGAVAAAPVTGKTVDVKMVGDAQGYRFEPANFTVKAGDAIKFTFVSGGPHNVAFDPATIPAGTEAQLSANMPNQMSPLQSQFFNNAGETYTISTGGLKPGQYPYHCVPHMMMNPPMKGVITIQ